MSSASLYSKAFQRISLAACSLAFIVIILGAYVRLSDAGLGCPDWPGCFGKITAPKDAQELSLARDAYPHVEVDSAKAWKEMIHRYFASFLGLLIIGMAYLAWRNRKAEGQQLILPVLLVGLVIFQGMLGMWTVTQLVHPTIVTLHLLAGLLTLALLFWVLIKHSRPWLSQLQQVRTGAAVRWLARLSVPVLALQIFLGGWTSTNYVALYCPDFPTCQGQWLPQLDFDEAFVFFKDTSVNYEGGTLSLAAGVTVHFMHRVGALLTTLVLLTLGFLLLLKQQSVLRKQAWLLLFLLGLQISLGIANVLLVLPIPIAVAHNAGAALLLLGLLLINYSLSSTRNPVPTNPNTSRRSL
ncbi:MAG TPA: COX15/CtaA family protein [Gammaproteobacteria bacterium]